MAIVWLKHQHEACRPRYTKDRSPAPRPLCQLDCLADRIPDSSPSNFWSCQSADRHGKCIIHQRYHCKAERWLGVWLRSNTHIVDITFTLTSLIPAQLTPSPFEYHLHGGCGACGSRSAARGFDVFPQQTLASIAATEQIQAHLKPLVIRGITLGNCQ